MVAEEPLDESDDSSSDSTDTTVLWVAVGLGIFAFVLALIALIAGAMRMSRATGGYALPEQPGDVLVSSPAAAAAAGGGYFVQQVGPTSYFTDRP